MEKKILKEKKKGIKKCYWAKKLQIYIYIYIEREREREREIRAQNYILGPGFRLRTLGGPRTSKQ